MGVGRCWQWGVFRFYYDREVIHQHEGTGTLHGATASWLTRRKRPVRHGLSIFDLICLVFRCWRFSVGDLVIYKERLDRVAQFSRIALVSQ